MIFVLQNIRSAWNVGQVFRTADALGAEVVCLGYTATPDGHASKLVTKTAIGAEKTVTWHKCETPKEVLTRFPKSNYLHVAIEVSKSSALIYEYLENLKDSREIVLWLGNEISGLDPAAIALCEAELHLPMLGLKESLNVSNVATTVGYLFGFRSFLTKNSSTPK